MEDFISIGINVVTKEMRAIELLQNNMPKDFAKAAHAISTIKGRLVVSGMGKSGYVGNKISASFASTGTRSFYIHPSEASHGDLGMIDPSDIVLILSNSGETKEIIDIVGYCKEYNIPIIGMTMYANSLLAQSSEYLLNIPKMQEASNVNAPTTSTTMMMVLGDALMIAVHESKGFTEDEYATFHPGGNLGMALTKVGFLMHKGSKIPKVRSDSTMDVAILEMTSKGFGCAAVVNENEKLIGIITDGDLRRNMCHDIIQKTSIEIMTTNPVSISINTKAADALKILNSKKITTLFIEENGILCGIIHIHDLLRIGIQS